VVRRKWLDDATFTDIVGLCQFLPGPASTQVGFAIGLLRGGLLGALAAWAGFTLPSALLMFVASGHALFGRDCRAGPLWRERPQHAPNRLRDYGHRDKFQGVDRAGTETAIIALVVWKTPPWMVVIAAALLGVVSSFVG
jgi:chromate transport protein ChrA